MEPTAESESKPNPTDFTQTQTPPDSAPKEAAGAAPNPPTDPAPAAADSTHPADDGASAEDLRAEIAGLKDRFLREAAEHDNFRRRLLKDKEEAIKYANSKLLSDLLEVIDNFERALQSGETNHDFPSFFDGVSMIKNQLLSLLDTQYGLKQMAAKGQLFNPEIHEAVAILPSTDPEADQTVLEEVLKGYTLGERVLRHAKVVVAKTSKPESESEAEKPSV